MLYRRLTSPSVLLLGAQEPGGVWGTPEASEPPCGRQPSQPELARHTELLWQFRRSCFWD